jgi:hypothetical protein
MTKVDEANSFETIDEALGPEGYGGHLKFDARQALDELPPVEKGAKNKLLNRAGRNEVTRQFFSDLIVAVNNDPSLDGKWIPFRRFALDLFLSLDKAKVLAADVCRNWMNRLNVEGVTGIMCAWRVNKSRTVVTMYACYVKDHRKYQAEIERRATAARLDLDQTKLGGLRK